MIGLDCSYTKTNEEIYFSRTIQNNLKVIDKTFLFSRKNIFICGMNSKKKYRKTITKHWEYNFM